MTSRRNFLGLDVGDKRVGIAIASDQARLPRPLLTLIRDQNFWQKLKSLVDENDIGLIVIGIPRNLSGQPTAQTELTLNFEAELIRQLNIPTIHQDEALTSHSAEQSLKSKGTYTKEDIDSAAACLILDDYLTLAAKQ